jgi:16S rRNA (guanine(966)-N(2))-methyltransferase RsmD
MRIIAGTHRGRTIKPPPGRRTRPITDRVRENLFNILGNAIDGAIVADCFAGTGTMGIEALSRGAHHATFVEKDNYALRVLKDNLHGLELADRATVRRSDIAGRGLPAPPGGRPFDVVFFDPPYRLSETDAERLWLNLNDAALEGRLAEDVIIVWRHDSKATVEPPPTVAALAVDEHRRYGSQTLTFIVLRHEKTTTVE